MSYIERAPLDENSFPPYLAAKQAFGFIPNLFRAQSLRPDVIEAEAAFVGSVLLTEGSLTRQQKEYVFLVCSAANMSTYCVTAHCEIVRALGLKGPDVEEIAVNHLETDLPEADKELLSFALKLNKEPLRFDRADVDRLRERGFGDQAILEAVLVVSIARWANLLARGLGAQPDFEPPKKLGLPPV